MPPSTPPPVMPKTEVLLGSNIDSVLPSFPPLPMITTPRISIGMNETIAKVSMARIASRTPK